MLHFFGLTPDDRYNVTREACFNLVYYGGVTISEYFEMPLRDREWWLKRIAKEFDGKNGAQASKASHHNTPEVRELQGMTRTEGPARTRRFT